MFLAAVVSPDIYAQEKISSQPTGIAEKLGVANMAPPAKETIMKAFGAEVVDSANGGSIKINAAAQRSKPRRTNFLVRLKDKFPDNVRKEFYKHSACGIRAFQLISVFYPDQSQTMSLMYPCSGLCYAQIEKYDLGQSSPKLVATSDPVSAPVALCALFFNDSSGLFYSDEFDESGTL